jgi:hypothetical protein
MLKQEKLFGGGSSMYCTNCGTEMAADARFCTGCGAKVNAFAAPRAKTSLEELREESVAVPVQLRVGMLKTQTAVLLFGRSYSALIRLEKKQYENIVAAGNKGGNYFQKVAGMMAAFGEYAKKMEAQPVGQVVKAHPGSVLFEDVQIRRLRIWNGWDPSREQYDDFYSFELLAAGEKYKGTLERNVNAQAVNARLRGMLGGRFG